MDQARESQQTESRGENQWESLKKLAKEVCERENCQLYDLEFVTGSRGAGRVVRVYIDRPAGGVTLDDCSNVSKGLSLLLDVEDVVPGGAYSLEVSSPGLERPLREKWHFDAAVGSKIDLRLRDSLGDLNPQYPQIGRRMKVIGELNGTDEKGIFLAAEGMDLKIPYESILRGKKMMTDEVIKKDLKDKKNRRGM